VYYINLAKTNKASRRSYNETSKDEYTTKNSKTVFPDENKVTKKGISASGVFYFKYAGGLTYICSHDVTDELSEKNNAFLFLQKGIDKGRYGLEPSDMPNCAFINIENYDIDI